MTDKELLAKAIVFDGGQEIVLNGYICNPEFDNRRFHYEITFGGKGWAIRIGGRMCLSKVSDEFEFESMPSERTEEYFTNTRFATVHEAFVFLEGWKKRQLFKAMEDGLLVWHPDKDKRKPYVDKRTLGGK